MLYHSEQIIHAKIANSVCYSTPNVNLYMINDSIGYTYDRIGYRINATDIRSSR